MSCQVSKNHWTTSLWDYKSRSYGLFYGFFLPLLYQTENGVGDFDDLDLDQMILPKQFQNPDFSVD